VEFVYFGGVDWGYTWQRPQQLATRLARAGRLLYVNPLGLRPPRWRDAARLLARVRAGLARPADPVPPAGVTVRSLWGYLPWPDSPAVSHLNAARLGRMIHRWRPTPAGEDLVLWAGMPSPAILPLAETMPGARLVYDCLDDFAAFHPDAARIEAAEARLAARAGVVFATAETLERRMRRLNARTLRLPNGADADHFAPVSAAALPVPPDVARIPGPVLGYVGEMARWFDVELVRALARHDPGWQIVLIGPVHGNPIAPLRALPNVHYLGPKPYRELPAYVHRFDVGLLPFRIDRLTAAVDPVKLYEYLAAGKPVVSTHLPEASRHGDVVTIADGAAFPAAVAAALRGTADAAGVARRVAVARENSWDRRAADALRALGAAEPVAVAAG
jgi:glycosyltransferase involved in cell wall biosynthesis